MINKNVLRIKAKNIRQNLSIVKISAKLIELIQKHEIYKNSNNIMFFYPKEYEIDFRELLKDDKNFYLPRVNGKELEVCPYRVGDKLSISKFGVCEPLTEKINPQNLDLVIVPALMIDEDGNRLGYGGGFYDRFINKYGEFFKTLTALPKELIIQKLPTDEYDKKIDYIVICDESCL